MSRYGFEQLESLEWLETNGLGGYASSTYSGANSRRYHGVLVAALKPPLDRRVLLTKLDERVTVDGQSFVLAENRFKGVAPGSASACVASVGRDLFPVVEFEVGGAHLRKTIAALQGENSTLIRYELLAGLPDLGLELRPFLAPRGIHELARANGALRWDFTFADGLLRTTPYEGGPELFLSVPGSSFAVGQAWWYRFQYQRERERGLDFEEDLFTHGQCMLRLARGAPVDVLVSTLNPSGRDTEKLWQRERERREALRRPYTGKPRLLGRLALAADQFLARRGKDQKTVIAGYPWFEDWGRDTMISLRGLCLSTGKLAEARDILEAFLSVLDQGMLPNRFPEAGSKPEYNTVDATLWLFVAVNDYWRAGGDQAFVFNTCLPALLDSLDWHRRGTRYGIKVAPDGLLAAGEAGVQLTWMDAKVGDWVVTPRQGKAVEVNALWYNALRVTEAVARAAGREQEAKDLLAQADTARAAFERQFWNASAQAVYDVLGEGGPDPSVRPNQIFCLSLPFPLFDAGKSNLLLATVERELLTPRGLRSLSRGDPRYVGHYDGDVIRRDGSYHQGTVWAWLLGPYMEALIRVRGDEGRRQARAILEAFESHLDEACLGSVSEIFDGDAPYAPKGCYAQAWSVAELLRVGKNILTT